MITTVLLITGSLLNIEKNWIWDKYSLFTDGPYTPLSLLFSVINKLDKFCVRIVLIFKTMHSVARSLCDSWTECCIYLFNVQMQRQ